MSWLRTQAERSRGRRPYPVVDLAVALGIPAADRHLTSKLALALGLNRGWVLRCRTLGLTVDQAEDWAMRAGEHPAYVWRRWEDPALPPAGLANANKATCPKGHRYDGVDSRGYRICRECKRAVGQRVRANPDLWLHDRQRGHGPAGHGSISRYGKGCRCSECRAAQRDYMRAWRAKKSADAQVVQLAQTVLHDPACLSDDREAM